MRHILALSAMVLLVPAAHAREQQDFHERVKDAVQRTDKDFETLVHRDKLDTDQRERFDAALKDLTDFREAIAKGQWDGGKEQLQRTIDDIDSVVKHAPIDEGDRQTLGIDLYTLRTIYDSWKP